tara:strand:- start:120 stop:593 length:474 start_codon:yes stop_codon:yes gene_type:complete
MAFTRFNYDESRTKKLLQESTGPGRYVLNVPGSGIGEFWEDPHIRLTQNGGNVRTNSVNLESDLIGLTRKINRDHVSNNNYNNFKAVTGEVKFKTNVVTTDQSLATHPSYLYRGKKGDHWYYLPLDPQEHVCMPFHNNLSSRILQKDNYVPSYLCNK